MNRLILLLLTALPLVGCRPTAPAGDSLAPPSVGAASVVAPSVPPAIDESEIARTERSEPDSFGMYTVTDYLEQERVCRTTYYIGDNAMAYETYCDYDAEGRLEAEFVFNSEALLLPFAVFSYDAANAARREVRYLPSDLQRPQAVTDTDAIGRVVYRWQRGTRGEYEQEQYQYASASPQVVYTFSLDCRQDRVPQDRPGLYIQVSEMFDSQTISYQMAAPENYIIYGGHSSMDGAFTSLSLIECDPNGGYLLQNSFNAKGERYYVFDCQARQVLLDDQTLAPT